MKAGYLPRNEAVAAAGGVWQALRGILVQNLTYGERCALLALLDADGPHRDRRPGRGTVARWLVTSDSTAGDLISGLIRKGAIRVDRPKQGRTRWVFRTAGKPGSSRKSDPPENPAVQNGGEKENPAGEPPENPAGEPPGFPAPTYNVCNVHPGFEPQGSIQVEAKPEKRGKTGKPDFDPKKITATAKAQGDRQRASGDTELVHGLGKLLGNGKADHATWCLIDRLAVGQGNIRGTRDAVTRYLLDKANEVIDDGAEHPAAAFTAKVRSMPAMARAWPKTNAPG